MKTIIDSTKDTLIAFIAINIVIASALLLFYCLFCFVYWQIFSIPWNWMWFRIIEVVLLWFSLGVVTYPLKN